MELALLYSPYCGIMIPEPNYPIGFQGRRNVKKKKATRKSVKQVLFELGTDDGFRNVIDEKLRKSSWYYLKGLQAGKRRYREFLASPGNYPLGFRVPPEPLPPMPYRSSQYETGRLPAISLSAIIERSVEAREDFLPSFTIDLFRLRQEFA
jgi:hypothetical protein